MQEFAGSNLRSAWQRAMFVTVFLGLAFRLIQFFQCRDLWLDEAVVALNIVQRDFAGLTRPLDYGQAAPMGFLWLTRICVLVFGENPYSLRLLPCLAGCAAVLLFFRLVRFTFPDSPGAQLFSLWIFSINEALINYSAQVKPYAFDALFATIILHQSGRLVTSKTWHAAAALAATLFIGPWFSFASFFLLCGVTLVLLVQSARKSSRQLLFPALTASALGTASFLFHYFAFTRQRVTPGLIDMWAGNYLEWMPHSMAELTHTAGLLASTVTDPVGLSSIGVACLLLAMAPLQGRKNPVLLIALAAFVTAAIFSSMRLYPWISRLLLFAVPCLALWLASGMNALGDAYAGDRRRRLWFVIAVSITCIAWPIVHLSLRVVRPFADQGITRVMQTLEFRGEQGSILCIDESSAATFYIYNRWRRYDERFKMLGPISSHPPSDGTRNVWLLFPDVFIGGKEHRESVLRDLDSRGTRLDAVEYLSSAAYKYSF